MAEVSRDTPVGSEEEQEKAAREPLRSEPVLDPADLIAEYDDLESDEETELVLPALYSGTSSEFLGRKPIPRAVSTRPLLFLLGPLGVGKTSVARRLLGEEALHLSDHDVLDALTYHVLYQRWPDHIRDAEALIVDSPCFLPRRPVVGRVLEALIRKRVAAGRRTIFCESQDRSPVYDLMGAVLPGCRATVMLRFPVGRGRRRYAVRMCDQMGVSRKFARRAAALEPWNYADVERMLQQEAVASQVQESDEVSAPVVPEADDNSGD